MTNYLFTTRVNQGMIGKELLFGLSTIFWAARGLRHGDVSPHGSDAAPAAAWQQIRAATCG